MHANSCENFEHTYVVNNIIIQFTYNEHVLEFHMLNMDT